MSDLVHAAHADAGLNLLAAIGGGLTIYDGSPPPPPPTPPYVVVHTTVMRPRGETGQANALDALSVTYSVTYSCHCVGLTARSARAVQMLVDDALTDVTPAVAGRSCGRIGCDDLVAPDAAADTGRDVYGAISVYSYFSAPG